MSPRVYRINALLSRLLHPLPIGTNLALFYLIWTLLSGRLLASRGAISGALDDARLPKEAVRRSMAALASGQWQIAPLVAAFAPTVQTEGVWRPHCHDGYHPVAGDLVGFFRPRLHGCPTTHYSPAAGRSLPAIPVGVAVRIGAVIGQRVPVPLLILRSDPAPARRAGTRRCSVRSWPVGYFPGCRCCSSSSSCERVEHRFLAPVAQCEELRPAGGGCPLGDR